MRGWSRLFAWAGLLALIALVPIVIGWSGLPDPVATHWGPGGEPDGSTPRIWIWAVPVFVLVVGLGLAALLRQKGRPSAESVAIVGLMGGIGVWTSVSMVLLNYEATTWQEAAPFDLWQVFVLLAAGLGLGWMGYLLGRRWYPPEPPTEMSADELPALEIGADERVSWMGSVRVIWVYLVLVPLGVAFLFLPDWLPWLALVFLALSVFFSQITVIVDRHGLKVKLIGLVTAKSIAIEDIRTVRAIDLEPNEWAGWGYRVVPGGSAVVLRRGPAIEVGLANARRFAVTVDDAVTGAAVLNGLVRLQIDKS